jgi:hypothetical protein
MAEVDLSSFTVRLLLYDLFTAQVPISTNHRPHNLQQVQSYGNIRPYELF